ncbi:MAG: PAS domain-containing protein [Caldilineaceae bacterium]
MNRAVDAAAMNIRPICQPIVLIIALALTGLLFLLDFVVPGSNFWGRYLLPILFIFLFGRRRDVLIVTISASVLIVAGHWLGPTPPASDLLMNRVLPVVVVWLVAWVLAKRMRMQEQLLAQDQEILRREQDLERQVSLRTADLQASEQRFAKIFQANPGGIAITRQSDGCCVDANDAYLATVGYTRDQLVGHSLVDLGIMPAEVRAEVRAKFRQYGYIRGLDLQITNARGELVNILYSLEQIDINGEPCYLGLTFDITARLQAEKRIHEALQRLRLATDAAGIGIWNWNLADDSLDWDERMCELYGVPVSARKRAIYYDVWRSSLHPDDLVYAESTLKAAVKDGTPWQIHFRIVLPDGTVRHIHTSSVIDYDQRGSPLRVIGINRDVTDQVLYEQLLQDSNAVLEQRVAQRTADLQRANQLKDEFMAMISHELRTPLTGVLTLSEMLAEGGPGPLNERQAFYVKGIAESGERLLTVINGILSYTHLISGKVQFQHERCDLAALLTICATAQQHRASARQQVIVVKVEPVDLTITSDSSGIAGMLKNLLDNAIKFTPEGGRVGLEAYPTPAPPGIATPVLDSVDLVVWDTGVGITPGQMEYVRKPFVQADGSLSRRHEGLGMGLAYVDQMARMLGGTLVIESVPSEGSRFIITLPAT